MPPCEKVAILSRRSPRLLESGRHLSKEDDQSSSYIQLSSHSRRGKVPPSKPNVSPSLVLRRSPRLSIPEKPNPNSSQKKETAAGRNKSHSDFHATREPISECSAKGKPIKCREKTIAKLPREESIVPETKKRKKIDEDKSLEWTSSQEMALQRAYLSAKPNPNFWKEVSKMVPGKSAQECYDKIHSDYKSPLPRSRLKKTNLGEQSVELSASKVLKIVKSNPKSKHNTSWRTAKSVAKHSSRDTKPVVFDMNGGDFSSPAVLKPVKNIGLHERFLGQLHNREMKRKAASTRSKDTLIGKENTNVVEHLHVKAAKSALLSHARFAASQLLHPQFE